MSILFNLIEPEEYHKHFIDGFQSLKKYTEIIRYHIDRFINEPKYFYEYDGYFFVRSSIEFMDDYVYYYSHKFDNLSIIDVDRRRVYMKRLTNDAKDINTFCNKYCKNVFGFEDFCSGEMTKDFLEITKEMKYVDK